MASGAKPLIRATEKWPREIRAELRLRVRLAANQIADEARLIAGEHSKSIPPTIMSNARISSTKVTGVVTAGGRASKKEGGSGYALAGLYEYGNKGGAKSAASARRGEFRHPVFSSDRNAASYKGIGHAEWVTQNRYPFLKPAIKRKEKSVQKGIEDAVNRAARRAGMT